MNRIFSFLLLATFLIPHFSLGSGLLRSDVKCKNVNQPQSQTQRLYRYVDQLAELHVYYGSISIKKSSAISKVYLTDSCTKGNVKGAVIRFQVFAKENQKRAQAKLFYCYSKVLQYSSGDFRNQGTFCALSRSKFVPTVEFPYDQPSDPYSRFQNVNTQSGDRSGDGVDQLWDEFRQARQSGIDSGFDPFYDSQNRGRSSGPDEVSGDGF